MDTKPQAHLINIIRTTKDHHPNFCLFLGAGASVTSGVSPAKELINSWRESYKEMYCQNSEDNLKKEYWYDKEEEYSTLFEKLYDQPSQRREFIEQSIRDAAPSWGYVYLVNLIKRGVFNTVFTTNFDDLLNEACYLYSNDTRPIVCAHDSSMASIRITSKRPKIMKLHGDFLFDGIKNTIRELESLEKNTFEKVKQFASEFGFIVVGYQGNDRSIMDAFNTLLNFDNNFPHGIYWCVRKNAEISKRVDLLRRYPKFHLIEIEGFDEFFAELNDKLCFDLQGEVLKPYENLAKRLNSLACIANVPSPSEPENKIIARDINKVQSNVAKVLKAIMPSEDNPMIEIGNTTIPIPLYMLANLAIRSKEFTKAFDYIEKDIIQNPIPRKLIAAFRIIEDEKALDQVERFVTLAANQDLFGKHKREDYLSIAVSLMNIEMYSDARKVVEIWHESIPSELQNDALRDVNLALTMLLDSKEINDELKISIERYDHEKLPRIISLGIWIVLKNTKNAAKLIRKIHEDDPKFLDKRLSWPLFKYARTLSLPSDANAIISLTKFDDAAPSEA